MTQCARPGCSASILFVRMAATGRPMPIDPAPDDRGNIAAQKAPRGYVNGRYLAKDEQLREHEIRFMPHWGTCNDPAITGRPQKRSRPKPREPRALMFPPDTLPLGDEDPPPTF